MEKDIDIHNYEKKFESALRKMQTSNISKRNKKLIEKFYNFCFANGIGKPRVVKYLGTLRQLAEWLKKDFDKVKQADIERVVTSIQQREDYTEWTKTDYNITLKKFYKWVNHGEYPKMVKWLKTCPNRSKTKLPGQDGLLTEDDIKKLIEAADHPRNKALISLLYESGCRIGEIASLRINNIAFDEKGAILTVFGKTGSRRIRVVSSVSYLLTLINNHPFKDDNKSPLWINIGAINNRKHMKYGTIRSVLQDIFKKAGVKKKFNPHLFRHSRATFLANFLTEAQLKVYFGWVQGSRVAGTYVHLSGRDTDQKILEINGMAKENEKKLDELKPKICPRCNTLNSYSSNYCSKCASILDIETAMKEQEEMVNKDKRLTNTNDIMSALIKDSEVQSVLLKKIHELNLGKKLKEL